ncbi:NUDIX domain-containing protein [Kitasatospora sp. NPDC059811]|uniref:NUDIX domain-containing protein n=1 Tax=Kitasatospora sp. NPDC059811 TaxID=3346957 RepID=UPI00365E5D50
MTTLPTIMTDPPGRRSGNLALVLNPDGAVLMVEPAHKPGRFILPGGSAEPNEPPNEAAARHVLTETGLVLDLWQIVAVDYVSAGEIPEGLNLVFWGGQLSEFKASKMVAPPVEESGVLRAVWVSLSDLASVTTIEQRARVIDALRSMERGAGVPLLLRGLPAGA